MIAFLAGAVLLAGSIGAPLCATVPHSGEVITGKYAECRAGALEVRFQLAELAGSKDQRHITRDKLKEFALAQSSILDVCVTGSEARP